MLEGERELPLALSVVSVCHSDVFLIPVLVAFEKTVTVLAFLLHVFKLMSFILS